MHFTHHDRPFGGFGSDSESREKNGTKNHMHKTIIPNHHLFSPVDAVLDFLGGLAVEPRIFVLCAWFWGPVPRSSRNPEQRSGINLLLCLQCTSLSATQKKRACNTVVVCELRAKRTLVRELRASVHVRELRASVHACEVRASACM